MNRSPIGFAILLLSVLFAIIRFAGRYERTERQHEATSQAITLARETREVFDKLALYLDLYIPYSFTQADYNKHAYFIQEADVSKAGNTGVRTVRDLIIDTIDAGSTLYYITGDGTVKEMKGLSSLLEEEDDIPKSTDLKNPLIRDFLEKDGPESKMINLLIEDPGKKLWITVPQYTNQYIEVSFTERQANKGETINTMPSLYFLQFLLDENMGFVVHKESPEETLVTPEDIKQKETRIQTLITEFEKIREEDTL